MYKYLLILCLLTATPVWAQSVSDTSSKLKDIEENLSAEQKVQDDLKEKQKLLEKELKNINVQTSKTVKTIKATERDAAKIRGKINELSIAQDDFKRKRSKTEKMIVPLLSNAMDIKSIPADLNLFLNNEADIQSQLTTHVALQSAAKTIKILLEDYQDASENLALVQAELEDEQEKLDASLKNLSKERDVLTKQIKSQEALKAETDQDLDNTSKTVSELQLRRESLSTLLDQLKREEIERKEARARERARAIEEKKDKRTAQPKKMSDKTKQESSTRKMASGLPASGYIVSDFGDVDPDSGLDAQGITIEGEPQGLVTAPKSGEVRYTGSFRSMGQMVLIEHKNGDFSLLAGLFDISVREGQNIEKDAPIGALSSSTNPLPRLYYELRRNGEKPVDPKALF